MDENAKDGPNNDFSIFEDSISELEDNQASITKKVYLTLKLMTFVCDYLMHKDPEFEKYLDKFNDELNQELKEN